MAKRRHQSTAKRIESISKLAEELYEEGNQSKCYAAIWRSKIYPQYGICYRTFLSYVKAASNITNSPMEQPQQKLFD